MHTKVPPKVEMGSKCHAGKVLFEITLAKEENKYLEKIVRYVF